MILLLVGAALAIPVKTVSDKAMKGMLVTLFAAALAFNSWLIWNVLSGVAESYVVNVFVANGASLFISEIILLIGLMSLLYSIKFMTEAPLKTGLFYGAFSLLMAALIGTTLAVEVIALYAFLETMTVTSAVLVLYGRGALRATMIYLVAAILGAILVLVGVFFMYSFAGTTLITRALDFQFLTDFQRLLISSLFFVGFGIKAGIIPFGLLWVPPSYSAAPTPITVVLTGMIANVAIFTMAKTIYIFYPLLGQDVFTLTVSSIGIASILVGGVLAFLQSDIKKLLAYSSISHYGYIVLSLGLGIVSSDAGLAFLGVEGGLFHILNHAIFKSLLFLAIGNIILRVNTKNMREMGGLWKKMPVTLILFLIGVFSTIGLIPGFNGFQSKEIIHEAIVVSGISVVEGFSIFGILAYIGSGITVLYLARAVWEIFLKKPKNPSRNNKVKEAPIAMLVPIAILAVLCIAIGVFPEIIAGFLDRASEVLGGLIS